MSFDVFHLFPYYKETVDLFFNTEYLQNEVGEYNHKKDKLCSCALKIISDHYVNLRYGDPYWEKRLIKKLETLHLPRQKDRSRLLSIYRKIRWFDGVRSFSKDQIIRVQATDGNFVKVPQKKLCLESKLFERLLKEHQEDVISLNGEKKLENRLVKYLKGLKIHDKNVIKLLDLAKSYEMTDLAMQCLERMLPPQTEEPQKAEWTQALLLSDSEKTLHGLMVKAKECGITVLRIEEEAHIQLKAGTEEEWSCLERIHREVTPVTYLSVPSNKDFHSFQKFVQINPNLISLNLGSRGWRGDPPFNISEDDLRELSKNLNHLHSFSIRSNTITAIPEAISNQTIKYLHIGCPKLKSLNTCAFKIYDYACNELTSLSASETERLICNRYPKLTKVHAPKAKIITFRKKNNITELHLNIVDPRKIIGVDLNNPNLRVNGLSQRLVKNQ